MPLRHSRRPRRKLSKPRKVLALGLCLVLLPGSLIYINVSAYRHLISPSVSAAPPRPVAIVFGAAGTILSDRVETGVELYKGGKVRKLLMTGDNGREGYDEPDDMKQEAVSLGVPARDIVCDYAGFRTYDSLYRARDIFGVRSAILVTQGYHLPRALFLGRKMGLDVVGVDAAKRAYVGQGAFDLREVAAIEIAWLQANITHPPPKFLGKPETSLTHREIKGSASRPA